jgi:hypothetical protein
MLISRRPQLTTTPGYAYPDFADHFSFFLTLAGITTVREIRNNTIDIKATERLIGVEVISIGPGPN